MKARIWIEILKEALRPNHMPLWVDYTFDQAPKPGDIIFIAEDCVDQISNLAHWRQKYGPGEYIIEFSDKIPSLEERLGIPYGVFANKC